LPQLRLERGESIGVAERAPDRVGGEDTSVDAYARLKPGPGRTAAEVAFHQRDRINRAVVEVVARRGYRRATIREIAGVAGISTRAFYQHYSSKGSAFWARIIAFPFSPQEAGPAALSQSRQFDLSLSTQLIRVETHWIKSS
jgi:Bacterial regulatory proteins, tetR family